MRRQSLSGRRLALQPLEDRHTPSTAFLATDLVSDQPGVAPLTDPNLVNAWGISLSPNGGPFWVSANGTGKTTLYGGDSGGTPLSINSLVVDLPGGSPTGQVFNGTGNPTEFNVSDGKATKAAVFLFASEAGVVTGWNPAVGVAAGATPPSHTGETGFQSSDGAIYKGLSLAKVGTADYLYATDFHNGKVDVIDGQFHQVPLGKNGFESFADPNLPKGFAPFGIANVGGKLYVSYAKQDADAHDDAAGPGHGFIDVFEPNGHLDQRLVSRGDLNSPWGMVQAPAGFGDFAGDLLVGNFGDGRIHAYDPATGKEAGTLTESPGHPLVIDGLWGLAVGNGKGGGDANTLYYSAGPDHEAHGLFGKITANPAGTNPVSATLAANGDLVITGSRHDDRVTVTENRAGTQLDVSAGGQRIGRFDPAAVGTIRFNGFAGDDVLVVDPRVTATVIADGGAGDDVLVGGGGNGVFVGGAGNDDLFGGQGRSVLIGGTGRDALVAGRGDTIEIGGSTAYDADPAALLKVLNAWTAPGSYSDRVAGLRGGANGVPKVDATTVTDDGVRDDLVGGPGLDWFVGQLPDVLHHRRANEKIN
jgi:uncharacterized protein (TIGR03118 family)